MPNVKLEFGTSTAITITLANLASSATAGRESTVVDNSANKFLDALVTVILNVITGVIVNDKAAYIWVYGSEDGTIYTDNATGTDAAITPEDPTCLRLVQVIPIPTSLKAYEVVFSIAQAFGGVLPRKWGIVVRNYCGLALAATGSSASYSGIYETVA